MTYERRRAPRFRLEQMVEIGFGKENFISAGGINISKTGLLCYTHEPIEAYSKIFLLISVPQNSRFSNKSIRKNAETTKKTAIVSQVDKMENHMEAEEDLYKEIKIEGVVMRLGKRNNTYEVGIDFTNISDADRVFLDEYIDSLEELS